MSLVSRGWGNFRGHHHCFRWRVFDAVLNANYFLTCVGYIGEKLPQSIRRVFPCLIFGILFLSSFFSTSALFIFRKFVIFFFSFAVGLKNLNLSSSTSLLFDSDVLFVFQSCSKLILVVSGVAATSESFSL